MFKTTMLGLYHIINMIMMDQQNVIVVFVMIVGVKNVNKVILNI